MPGLRGPLPRLLPPGPPPGRPPGPPPGPPPGLPPGPPPRGPPPRLPPPAPPGEALISMTKTCLLYISFALRHFHIQYPEIKGYLKMVVFI